MQEGHSDFLDFAVYPEPMPRDLSLDFSILPDRIPVGFHPLSRSHLGPAYARIAEASTGFLVPPEGSDSGRRVSDLCVSDPSRGPGRVFLALRPSRGVDSCVALGLPGHPAKGAVPRPPPRGCYETGHDPSPAHAGGPVTTDRGYPPHIPHLRARVSRDRGRYLATPFLY